MLINVDLHNKKKNIMEALRRDRLPWWKLWREIADFYLPKRYIWLMSDTERARYLSKNGNILDPTGTTAARVTAAGLMNGVTNPSRPWFKLRLAGFRDSIDHAARVWLDEVERRMFLVMAESNFYNSLAIVYIDLILFGTSSMLIYEDFKTVIRCYNNALGEFYLGQSARQEVNIFAREFTRKVHQVVEEWGLENCSDTVKAMFVAGGANHMTDVEITCLIEPNDFRDNLVSRVFEVRELYWETKQVGSLLEARGYFEMPGVWPRAELTGNDSYGTSLGLDALGDVIQLQHETKRKGQSLDYMIRPPMVMDVQLQHRPTAMLPGGQTFVSNMLNGNVGAKAAYQFTPPINELTLDIKDVQNRIKEIFHNNLFNRVMTLDTVRSASEIAKIDSEQLILIGPLLQRFNSEALDPAVNRIYNIMSRGGLLPEPPRSIANAQLEIQYVSILSAAQSASGVIPIERFLGLIGNIAPVYPKAVNIPNFEELIRTYGEDIGVPARGINSREEVEALSQDQDEAEAADKALAAAPVAADAGKLLSETQVGAGRSALQLMFEG